MDVNVSATFTLNSQGSGNAFTQSGVARGSSASSLLPPPSMYISASEALAAFSVDDNNVNTAYDASIRINYLMNLHLTGSLDINIIRLKERRLLPEY